MSRISRADASLAVLQITAPLITRKIIEQLTLANAYHNAQKAGIPVTGLDPPRSVGYGIGLAFALLVMNLSSSLFNYQSEQRGAVIGFLLRASVSRLPFDSRSFENLICDSTDD